MDHHDEPPPSKKRPREEEPPQDNQGNEMDLASLDFATLVQLFSEALQRQEDTTKLKPHLIMRLQELEAKQKQTNDETNNNNNIGQPQGEANEMDLTSLADKELDQLWREAIRRHEDTTKFSKESTRRIEEMQNLGNGTYYATYDQVWSPSAVTFEVADYNAMIRSEFPTSDQTLDGGIMALPFRRTLENAKNVDLDPATDVTQDNSKATRQIWRVMLGKSNFHNRNDATLFTLPAYETASLEETSSETSPYHELTAPVGRLVPDASNLASLYHHVAIWVFGLKECNYEPSFIQKLIHGSVPRPTPVKVPQEIDTGLKNMICNRVCDYVRDDFSDHTHLSRMIVPILSLQQAKEWNGQGYHALVMISSGHRNPGMGSALGQVAWQLGTVDLGEVASQQDIAVAGELLTATIKGLAYSFVERSSITDNWVSALHDDSREMLDELRRSSTVVNTNGDHRIHVPIERPDNEKPILKIAFAPAFGTLPKDGHPAPDPLLLAVKAGLTWSAFHEEPLMVMTPPQAYHSDEEEVTEESDENDSDVL